MCSIYTNIRRGHVIQKSVPDRQQGPVLSQWGEGAVTRASVSINLGPRYCSWYLYRHDEYLYSIAVTRHLARIPSFSVSTSLKQHKQMCTYNLLNGYIYLLCWQLSIWLCSFVQTTVNAILSTISIYLWTAAGCRKEGILVSIER